LDSLAFHSFVATGSGDSVMKNKMDRTLSRREFAQRAALLSATASLIPANVIRSDGQSAPPSSQTPQATTKLSNAAQTEADARYQQILSLYSDHLDEAQKANIKKMCAELQPSLERIRNFKLQNGDPPALYLKPLVEREKKSQPLSSSPKISPNAAKP
jgi:hypothetical protein